MSGQVALDLANTRLMTEREALDVARAEMEASKKEAAELADQMHAELEVAQARITDLEARLTRTQQEATQHAQELSTRLSQVQLENAALTARLEERDREIAERKANFSRLETKFDQLQKELLEIARGRSKTEMLASSNGAASSTVESVRHAKTPAASVSKKITGTIKKRQKARKVTVKARKKEVTPV